MNKVPELKKNMCLDIGCGDHVLDGFVGMDRRDCGQGIIWDARHGIPYPDNSIKDIRSAHFLEHLDDQDCYFFLQEVMRVLKKGGHFYCRVPDRASPGAFFPDHKTFWDTHRVDALTRLSYDILPFKITHNTQDGIEVIFTFEKI